MLSACKYRIISVILAGIFLCSNRMFCSAKQSYISYENLNKIHTLNKIYYMEKNPKVTQKSNITVLKSNQINVPREVSNGNKSGGYFDYKYSESNEDSWYKHITKNNKKYGNFYYKPASEANRTSKTKSISKTKKIFIFILVLFSLLLFIIYTHSVRQRNKKWLSFI